MKRQSLAERQAAMRLRWPEYSPVKHGHCQGSLSRTYKSWQKMVARCRCRTSDRYKYYGAKGVSVCDRWGDFANFLADMGPRPEGTTLGRILDRGDYEPGNVFWMTRDEQRVAYMNNRALRRWEVQNG